MQVKRGQHYLPGKYTIKQLKYASLCWTFHRWIKYWLILTGDSSWNSMKQCNFKCIIQNDHLQLRFHVRNCSCNISNIFNIWYTRNKINKKVSHSKLLIFYASHILEDMNFALWCLCLPIFTSFPQTTAQWTNFYISNILSI